MVQAEFVLPRLKSNWTAGKARIQERWPVMTDEDLEPCRNDPERLIRMIQLLTGEARAQVESILAEVVAELGPAGIGVVQVFRERWAETSAKAQGAARCLADTACARYTQAEGAIRAHPIEAIVSSFAAGILGGVAFALVRSHR